MNKHTNVLVIKRVVVFANYYWFIVLCFVLHKILYNHQFPFVQIIFTEICCRPVWYKKQVCITDKDKNFALEWYGESSRCIDHTEQMWEERSCTQVRQWQHWGSGCYQYTCKAGRLHLQVSHNLLYSIIYRSIILWVVFMLIWATGGDTKNLPQERCPTYSGVNACGHGGEGSSPHT